MLLRQCLEALDTLVRYQRTVQYKLILLIINAEESSGAITQCLIELHEQNLKKAQNPDMDLRSNEGEVDYIAQIMKNDNTPVHQIAPFLDVLKKHYEDAKRASELKERWSVLLERIPVDEQNEANHKLHFLINKTANGLIECESGVMKRSDPHDNYVTLALGLHVADWEKILQEMEKYFRVPL